MSKEMPGDSTPLRNAECELGVAANRFTAAEEAYSPCRDLVDPTQVEKRAAYVEAFGALKAAARALVAAEQADAEDDDVTDDRAALPWSPYERLPWEGAAQ